MRLTDFLGSIFSGVAGAEDGAHVRIWNELKPWVANLLPAATTKWLPRIAVGHQCEVPLVENRAFTHKQCPGLAVAACDVCHRPVCLHHARIDQYGDAICYICVADAVTAVPPLQRERARARGGTPGAGYAPGGHGHAHAHAHGTPPPKPGPSPQDVAKAMKILGVKPTSSWEEVRAAHRKLSAQFHPDRQKTTRQKTSAEAKFKQVQVAFEVLKTKYPEAA